MAISYTISYTFSPGTTISSSQVNTNFSDNANTWTGLEALTKSFSNLRVDTAPTAATDVAIKSYVDKLNSYRHPVLQYSSGTVVNLEAGINGTSGQAQILFPDGTLRTDSTAARINLTMSQTAAFSGTAQSGIDTGAVSANTWYSIYAAKVTDSSTNFVTTASLLTPVQANMATLNTRFGTSGWVYLGVLPYGDKSAATTAIPKFVMCGNKIAFYNSVTAASGATTRGVRLANTAGAVSLTWTYASGTDLSTGQVPAQIIIGDFFVGMASSTALSVADAANAINLFTTNLGAATLNGLVIPNLAVAQGVRSNPSGSTAQDVILQAYLDLVLGVGANPFL